MIRVKSDEVATQKAYRKLAWEILSEVHVTVIKDLSVYIGVKEGYFLASANIRSGLRNLTISDCAKLLQVDKAVKVMVDPARERFLKNVLDALYASMGSENITELSRYEILVKNSNIKDLENLTIVDLRKEAQSIAMEVLTWLMPEGFKVTTTLEDEEAVTILCSESSLKNEWIEKMKKLHEKFIHQNNKSKEISIL